jgi:hypothetical protein
MEHGADLQFCRGVLHSRHKVEWTAILLVLGSIDCNS